MRIALFVHCYFPRHYFGTEAYTRTLARELKALGHAPTIVSAVNAGEPKQDQLMTQYSIDDIPVVQIDRNFYPNRRLRDTFHLEDLKSIYERLLTRLQPDIAHICHLINHTTTLLEVTEMLNIPTFATFTDFFGFCYNNRLCDASGALCEGPNASRSNCVQCAIIANKKIGSLVKLAAAPGLRPVIARAVARRPSFARSWRGDIEALIDRPLHLRSAYSTLKAAIAPSRFLQKAYLQNGFTIPLELNHFGIDIDRKDKPTRNVRDEVRVGFIGQLAEHKAAHLLLSALRQLGSDRLRLEIWGDEKQDPFYSSQLRRLAEGQKVEFRGTFPVEDIASIFATIDVLVIPSTWYENAPLILLQALATHTPVVVSDVEGLTEFITPGVTGFSYPRGDTKSLARVLHGFAENPNQATAMSRRTSYERTSRTMAIDILDLYERHVHRGIQ